MKDFTIIIKNNKEIYWSALKHFCACDCDRGLEMPDVSSPTVGDIFSNILKQSGQPTNIRQTSICKVETLLQDTIKDVSQHWRWNIWHLKQLTMPYKPMWCQIYCVHINLFTSDWKRPLWVSKMYQCAFLVYLWLLFGDLFIFSVRVFLYIPFFCYPYFSTFPFHEAWRKVLE